MSRIYADQEINLIKAEAQFTGFREAIDYSNDITSLVKSMGLEYIEWMHLKSKLLDLGIISEKDVKVIDGYFDEQLSF